MIPGIISGSPATGGASPDPLVFPSGANITHWFRASEGVFSDAGSTPAVNDDPVQKWANIIAATGEDADQAVLANRPIFKTGGQNGQPYMDCPDTDERFFEDLAISHNGGITSIPVGFRTFAFVIGNWNAAATHNPLTGGTGAAGGKFDTHLLPSAGQIRNFKPQFTFSGIADPMIVVCSVESASASRIVINGTYTRISNATNPSSSDPTSLQFLRNTWTSLSSNFFDGRMYEFIIWGSGTLLAQADMEAVSAELNEIYAIY